MALDLSHLISSLGALERAQGIPADAAQWEKLPPTVREAVRAGVIQTFEVAYEQCWKIMRRWLERNPVAGDPAGATMRQIYRLAAKSGLIDDVDLWMEFHDARNRTSHTYDNKVAEVVFSLSLRFLPEAQRALKALEAKND